MKRSIRSLTGLLLALVLICAPLLIAAPASAASTSIQDGVTLHCWNWSFQNIEANMAKIARLGYTAIQTSPIQQAKQQTAGYQTYDWWVFYQPASFSIDNTGKSALGNKAQFKSMCDTAHEYGIKVIVDVVANHMGDNGGNNKSPAIIADLKNDSSCWHDISKNTYDYSKRYDVTQWCMNGLPDLNTGSSKVQNYVLNYLKECIDAGADGFRFDAAKHIETPDDGADNCASNFWPTVINGAKSYAKSSRGIELYCYGELLDSPGGNLSVSSYTKYMSITDNTWSNAVRNQVVGGSNAGAFSYGYHKDASASKLVLWAESHDNYTGDGSNNMSTHQINKTWALVAARADAMSLYLARPDGYTQKLGTASAGTGWASAEVAAINKFHTAFAGQSEYVANQGSIAYVERGGSGVVLVNCSGSSGSVNVAAHTMKDGSYKDQITGNTFTVSGGRIKGNIGSTGIAVVHNAVSSETPEPEQTIYVTNSAGWSKVNIYSWYTGGGEITNAWPGNAMKKVEGTIYSYTLPADASNVIFNNGSTQTDDLIIPAGKNLYDLSTGKWSVYTAQEPECTHKNHNTDGKCTGCSVYVGHSYGSNGTCVCGASTNIRCAHGVHDVNGICIGCGITVAHRYVDGICSCGAAEDVPDATLPTQPEVTLPTEPEEQSPTETDPQEPSTAPTDPTDAEDAAPPQSPTDATDDTQPQSPTNPTQDQPDDNNARIWLGVGVVIGILLMLILAAAVIVILKLRKNNSAL